MRKRTIPALVVSFVAVMSLGPCFISTASADDGGLSYDATSNAYGIDATVYNESLPLGITVEAAGPTAQSHLNSLDQSDAFASFPYPGDVVAGLPGTAGGLFNLPIPAYPMIVTTQAGDRPKDQAVPGIALHVESGTKAAVARSVVGAQGIGFTSDSRVEELSDKSIRASASTKLGVNLLNLIDISGISSSAEVTADGSTGKLTKSAHLSIGQISVPGLSIQVPTGTPGTLPIPIPIPGIPQLPPISLPVLPLPLGGQTIPVPDFGFEDGVFTVSIPLPGLAPVKLAVPAQLILDALKGLGIQVTYQQAEETTTGIIAPALTFKYRIPEPPKNNLLTGPTDIGLTLGRTTANVTVNAVLSQNSSTGSGSPPADAGSGTVAGGASAPAVSPPDGSAGVDATGVSSQPLAPIGGGSLPVSAGQPPATGSTNSPDVGQQAVAYPMRDTGKIDISGIYLVCILISAVAFVAISLLRLLGVRLLWVF